MARCIGEDTQDKDESVARTFNWTNDLDGATISGATWTMNGLTNESQTTTSPYTSVRASGAVPNQTHRLECTITTSNGETLQAYVNIIGED